MVHSRANGRKYNLVVGIVCSKYFSAHNSCFGLTTHNSMKSTMCLLWEKEAITLVYLSDYVRLSIGRWHIQNMQKICQSAQLRNWNLLTYNDIMQEQGMSLPKNLDSGSQFVSADALYIIDNADQWIFLCYELSGLAQNCHIFLSMIHLSLLARYPSSQNLLLHLNMFWYCCLWSEHCLEEKTVHLSIWIKLKREFRGYLFGKLHTLYWEFPACCSCRFPARNYKILCSIWFWLELLSQCLVRKVEIWAWRAVS
jgi:hypothetical protein